MESILQSEFFFFKKNFSLLTLGVSGIVKNLEKNFKKNFD